MDVSQNKYLKEGDRGDRRSYSWIAQFLYVNRMCRHGHLENDRLKQLLETKVRLPDESVPEGSVEDGVDDGIDS